MPVRLGLMWRLTVFIAIASLNAAACTFLAPEFKVSRSFSVQVKNDVGPVVGVKLKVSRFRWKEFEKLSADQQRYADLKAFEEIIAESTTDVTGIAEFNLDRTGSFTLSIEGSATQLDWVELKVFDQVPSPIVEMRWPSVTILRTARLRGKLAKGLFSSRSVPLRNNALMLHTLVDYKGVAAITTEDNGTFDFNDVAPGLYFLQIIPTSVETEDFYKPEGNIAVLVDRESPRDALMISTVNTSCGLMYDLEENKAHYKPEACFRGGKPVKCEY